MQSIFSPPEMKKIIREFLEHSREFNECPEPDMECSGKCAECWGEGLIQEIKEIIQ
jgi:hypothetical protein